MQTFDLAKLSAAKLRQAAQEDGFFILENHEIDCVEEMFGLSRTLFSSSVAKENYFYDPSTNSGFLPLRRERLNETAEDEKEAFNFRQFSLLQQSLPPQLDRDKIWRFMEQCHEICLKLLKALAVALELDEDRFAKFHSLHNPSGTVMRFLHYPSMLGEKSMRAGEHTDYGSMTLLFTHSSDCGGLEVKKGKDFIPVPSYPGKIIVNTGDLLEYWTGKRLKSTLHRVVVGSSLSVVPERFSIAYFCHPDDDTPIHLDRPDSADEPPLTARDHLLMRLRGSR